MYSFKKMFKRTCPPFPYNKKCNPKINSQNIITKTLYYPRRRIRLLTENLNKRNLKKNAVKRKFRHFQRKCIQTNKILN